MPKNSPWSHRHQRPGCAITLLAATTTLAALGHLLTGTLL